MCASIIPIGREGALVKPDGLAVVDVDPVSPSYSRVVGHLQMPASGGLSLLAALSHTHGDALRLTRRPGALLRLPAWRGAVLPRKARQEDAVYRRMIASDVPIAD